MKNNPILIFTGLAAAAVVAVAGVTKDRWMPANPETVASETVSTEEQTSAQKPAIEEKAPEQKQAEATQDTAADEPAAEPSQEAETEIAAIQLETDPANTAKALAPSFDTVRIEKTGEALIAGRAQPGSEVTVMLDGKAIGTTTANADGAFVLIPEGKLAAGNGALTVESRTGSETVAVRSEQSVAVIIPEEEKKETVVAVVSPDEPTKILQKTEPAAAEESTAAETAISVPVSLDTVDYDESGNIVFSGRGQPGTTVQLYVDNAHSGEAKAGDDGRWTFADSTPITTGKHTLRADGMDAAGAVTSRVELPFFREEPTKVASAVVPEQTAETAATAESTVSQTGETETTASQTAETTANVETETAASTETEATASGTTETAAADTTTSEPVAVESTTVESTEQTVAATTTETDVVKPKDGRIVIQPGNNLWRISRVIYGQGIKYTVIYESNKDQIRDPDLIFPGQVFMTPDVVPPETIDPARRDSLQPEEGGSAG